MKIKNTVLSALLACSIPISLYAHNPLNENLIIKEYVTQQEYNTYMFSGGFSQIIYRRDKTRKKYTQEGIVEFLEPEIIDYKPLKNENYIPVYDPVSKKYKALFYDVEDEVMREIISDSFTITRTYYDPEKEDKDIDSCVERKGLGKIFKKK